MRARALALVLLLLAPAPSARALLLDALVARVDGKAVTWSQVVRETRVRRLEGRPESERLPRVVRDALVRRKLLVAEALRLRMSAEPGEVDERLAALRRRVGSGFEARMKALGLTPEDLRARERDILLMEKYLRFRREITFVPTSAVTAFYRKNRDRLAAWTLAEVRAELRRYLTEKKYQRELEEWYERQVREGRVDLLPLPEESAP